MIKAPAYIRGLEEVSSKENGGKIIYATDDFFAVAENLLKPDEPQSNDKFTEFGKWMDGWETRRRRTKGHDLGHDWTVIALNQPCFLRAVCIDTAFFTGNHVPRFSLQGTYLKHSIEEEASIKSKELENSGYHGVIQDRNNRLGTAETVQEHRNIALLSTYHWTEVVPMTQLHPGHPETCKHYIKLNMTGDQLFTHLRFNIFPDGGVARLRVYGFGLAQLDNNFATKKNLVQGKCVEFSDAYFGHPDNLLKLEPTNGMHDGWETARRLDRPAKIQIDENGFVKSDGEEWAILQLEKTILVSFIEVDTTHFIGNCPDSVKIEGACAAPDEDTKTMIWETMLPRTKLEPNQSNGLVTLLKEIKKKPINYVRVVMMPDGGIARIRIYGNEYSVS